MYLLLISNCFGITYAHTLIRFYGDNYDSRKVLLSLWRLARITDNARRTVEYPSDSDVKLTVGLARGVRCSLFDFRPWANAPATMGVFEPPSPVSLHHAN